MIIKSISPIDGRYSTKTSELIPYFSEKALIKYRIYIEIKYLISLFNEKKLGLRELTGKEINLLESLYYISDNDAELIKTIETKGYKDIPATNHDVKAVEYFIKLKLANTSLKDVLEMIHFALTSEDINNNAYSLMVRDGFNQGLFPKIIEIYDVLNSLSKKYKDYAMLARTHGQPASPTTFGKEILVFVSRIKEEIVLLKNICIMSKLNGATGNYNAHSVVYPELNWLDFSEKFIKTLKESKNNISLKYCSSFPLELKYNSITTQIEPHDSFSRLFDSLKRINTIFIDFCQDIWRYISDGWIKQKPVKGEIGSSAMPHKVNPIDFENAEGNFSIANSLLSFFSSKLSISRLQRDLTDSTVLRNIGVAFAHSLVSYKSILKGLTKIEVDKNILESVLLESPEVISEAIQNILRAEKVEKPYELLKDLTRGEKKSLNDIQLFIKELNIKDKIKERLLKITPLNYIGLASKIVEEYKAEIY
jgi:adenylosuccinate lyase